MISLKNIQQYTVEFHSTNSLCASWQINDIVSVSYKTKLMEHTDEFSNETDHKCKQRSTLKNFNDSWQARKKKRCIQSIILFALD